MKAKARLMLKGVVEGKITSWGLGWVCCIWALICLLLFFVIIIVIIPVLIIVVVVVRYLILLWKYPITRNDWAFFTHTDCKELF